MPKNLLHIVFAAGMIVLGAATANANNLAISNVSLGSRDPNTKTLVVTFDVSWQNSWRNKINHDATWLTVRLNNTQASLTYKKLCHVSVAGLDPVGSSTGSASGLEFYVPTDKAGAFLRRSLNGKVADVTTQAAQLTIDYGSCGFADSDEVTASVFGLEMVFIPEGSFYAGDNNISTASLNKGNATTEPWAVASENAITVADPANNGFRYVSGGNAGEYATGASFTIPAAFPKGAKAFYVMKYELNEGQWIEFLNSLPSAAARAKHDLTDTNHKNSDSVIARNTIACSGAPLLCTTQRSSRAVSFLSWMDLAAFLDWAALRPLTELEFEKISRGPILPVSGEYIWGTTDILPAETLSGAENGSEAVSTTGANAHYNNTSLTGGDASTGVEHKTGPVRNGIFATDSATRLSAGASYYGVLDLGGNLKEHVVTIGNAAGAAFSGLNGDGNLSLASGYEGNADVNAWPGLDATVERGVTGAAGSGFRGGSWADSSDRLRVSDRFEAALTLSTATSAFGGRGSRTYDSN